MNTNFKIGTGALLAFAALAIGAAGAQAANFTAASYPALVSAEGTMTFTFEDGRTSQCEIFTGGGELSKATSGLVVEVASANCTNFGGEGTVLTNSCQFVFHPVTGSKDFFTGTFDIVCPAGASISVTGATCAVKIGAQTGKGPVLYERETTAPNKVFATFQMNSTAGFSYTKTADGAFCPLTGVGAKSDGVILGSLTLTAGSSKTFEPINLGIE